jgi:tryptophan halogenase
MSKNKSLNEIVILGGGTAGWLTALYAKKKFYDSNVTLVKSDDIGVLGAGEGTTPSIISFLDYLNIPASKIIKDADATIKNGIKFTNWNGDSSYYYHGFLSNENVGLSSFDNPEILPKTNVLHVVTKELDKPLSQVNFVEKIGEKNKVGFTLHPDYDNQIIQDPIHKYVMNSYFALHFNAVSFAKTLESIGIERGINVVEGIVLDIKQDKEGNISKLVLDTKEEIEVDFIFDCSGFKRLIIEKIYKSEWKSHKEKLPVDTAIPFFLPIDKDIPSYTESIAMKYGWMWKIPLQNRYGCGYVFDSSLVSEEDAKKEIEEYLGFKIDSPKTFKFNAGYYKKPWVKNCIAVGLSSGFIEPLEATSIWVSIINITNSMSNLNSIVNINDDVIEEFNKKFIKANEEIVDFIHLHYLTKRKDTEFWKKFNNKDTYSKELKNYIDILDYRVWDYTDFSSKMFPLESWISVGEGLDLINKKTYKDTYESNKLYDFISDSYEVFIKNQDEVVEKCMSHKDFIEDLKS